MTHILLISGSASQPSVNTETLRQLAELVEQEEGVTASFLETSLFDVPHFTLQGENEGQPIVDALRQEIAAAEAVVFSTPQHNGRVPAVLKNALDWSNRGEFRMLWKDIPVGVVSVSPGARGGAKANEQLREDLEKVFKARVVEPHIEVARFEELQANGGVFADEELKAQARRMLAALTAADAERRSAGA